MRMTVTQRAKEFKQPRGGFLNPSKMQIIQLEDGKHLSSEENVHTSIIGMVVGYLSRLPHYDLARDAFHISMRGAQIADKVWGHRGVLKLAESFVRTIDEEEYLSDDSIVAACKLVTFDVWFRFSGAYHMTKTCNEVEPDAKTIRNIRILVQRCSKFFEEYGPVVQDSFTFGKSGYTITVTTGDEYFLTKDTLWHLKVIKNKPTSKHTLQLLLYYVMGKHSRDDVLKNINKIGLYNPRLNVIYLQDMSEILDNVIKTIEEEVICYD